jgi:hypothetical protein
MKTVCLGWVRIDSDAPNVRNSESWRSLMWGGGGVKGARSGRFFRFFGIFLFAGSNGLGSIFHAVVIGSGRGGESGRIGSFARTGKSLGEAR